MSDITKYSMFNAHLILRIKKRSIAYNELVENRKFQVLFSIENTTLKRVSCEEEYEKD